MLTRPPFALPLLGVFVFPGCAARPPIVCKQPRTAQVFFATDRAPDTTGKMAFGEVRTRPPALQMGFQPVQIGGQHRYGLLDAAVAVAPPQVQRTGGGGSPKWPLHRTDAEIQRYASTTLRAALRSSAPPRGAKQKTVILYVHGFNNTFDYAIRKSAQMAADLELVTCAGEQRGVPVMYSWPSQDGLLTYLADEENVEWTQQRLSPFLLALSRVCREEGAQLHVLAHSMGARATIRSLAELARLGAGTGGGLLVDQLVLLAPDIGRGIFDQYAERVLPVVRHLTIYVSEKDRALRLSSLLHGGHGRLGLLESTVLSALKVVGIGRRGDARSLGASVEAVDPGHRIDMVDVTGGLADLTGHSYEDPEFIDDLRELLFRGTEAGTGARSNLEARSVRASQVGLTGKKVEYFRLRTR